MSSVACPLCAASHFSTVACLVSALIKFTEHPLNCPLCGHTVHSLSYLREHLLNHSHTQKSLENNERVGADSTAGTLPHELPNANSAADKPVKCRQCSYEAVDFLSLQNHVNLKHPERKFICSHCLKSFKVQASLTLHLRIAHSQTSSSHNRRHCHRTFFSQSRRDQHEKKHASQKDFTCSDTGIGFGNGAPLHWHLEHHGAWENNVNCNNDLRFTDTVLATTSHLEDKTFACPVCDKSFKKDQYLQQHIRIHEAKKWECQVCHKLFTTKEYLRKHTRLHTGETPYTCDICLKTFTFQQSYHKHLLYHTDERPYSCDDCGRRFKELSTLHNHQRIHTGEKPFQCETCGKAFRQRVSYIVHRRIHTGVLPYVCTSCGKSFRYKVSQRSHKCEPSKINDHQEIPSVRPVWLERLVFAQQNGSKLDDQAVKEVQETKEALPSTSALSPGSQGASESLNLDTTMELRETIPQPSLIPKMQYFPNDHLPTIDLSQLTLTLDSDLIFPT